MRILFLDRASAGNLAGVGDGDDDDDAGRAGGSGLPVAEYHLNTGIHNCCENKDDDGGDDRAEDGGRIGRGLERGA